MSTVRDVSSASSSVLANAAASSNATFLPLALELILEAPSRLYLREQNQKEPIHFVVSDYDYDILGQIIVRGYLDQYFPEVKQILFDRFGINDFLDERGHLKQVNRNMLITRTKWQEVNWDNMDETQLMQYETKLINDYLLIMAGNDPIVMREIKPFLSKAVQLEDMEAQYVQKCEAYIGGEKMPDAVLDLDEGLRASLAPYNFRKFIKPFVALIRDEVFAINQDRARKECSGHVEIDAILCVKKTQIDHAMIVLGEKVAKILHDEELEKILSLSPLIKAERIKEWMHQHAKRLHEIEKLNLADCHLAVLPAEIGLFKNLKKMNLECNQLRTLPGELKQLTKLRKLNLARNDFTTVPSCLCVATQLVSLNMSYNKLTTLPAEIISKLTKLERLFVAYNKILALPAEIGLLTQLETLEVSDNYLETFPVEIASCTKLRTLCMHYNPFTTIPKVICALENLEYLSCTHCFIEIVPQEIVDTRRLMSLNLSSNKLKTLPDLSKTHIHRLWLRDNSFAKYPENLPKSLGYLDLRHNDISSLSQEAHFPDTLELGGNPIADNFQKPAWLEKCHVRLSIEDEVGRFDSL